MPGRKAQQSGHPTTRQPDTAPTYKPRAAARAAGANSNHGGEADNVGQAPRSGNAPQAQTATTTAGKPKTWEGNPHASATTPRSHRYDAFGVRRSVV
ncbi:hypothetical protein GCM10009864_73630 [Streptomyces lunalinharesii]|uniref:Uncharacterized protein n=1 Tax=Streptomyces lunalinharesii TaxID=333384 RepID=A0ABN3SY91_9ACTN